MNRNIIGICPKCHKKLSFEISDWQCKNGKVFAGACPCGEKLVVTVRTFHDTFVANIETVEGERK